MIITTYNNKTRKTVKVELSSGGQVKDALEHLKINPVTVLVSRNNEIILEDEELYDGDNLKILSVISGG